MTKASTVTAFQAFPDFKGIKTQFAWKPKLLKGFRPSLISKGLRHRFDFKIFHDDLFQAALISKGLKRQQPACFPFGNLSNPP